MLINEVCKRCGLTKKAIEYYEEQGLTHPQICLLYTSFAYDTRFGFCASRSREVLNQAAPDSMLAFVMDDNVFVRKVSKTRCV